MPSISIFLAHATSVHPAGVQLLCLATNLHLGAGATAAAADHGAAAANRDHRPATETGTKGGAGAKYFIG